METQTHQSPRPHRLVLLVTDSSGGGGAPPPANGTRETHGSYAGGQASFDTNMVIILAALLCALVCALGLNSIVRCALRCGRRFAPEAPGEAAATGLKKSALRRIPVVVYGAGVSIPATECPICLGEFAGGEEVRILPKCNHGFHMRCIDTWLLSHSSCPTCRQSLPENLQPTDLLDAGHLPPAIAPAGSNRDVSVVVEEVS